MLTNLVYQTKLSTITSSHLFAILHDTKNSIQCRYSSLRLSSYGTYWSTNALGHIIGEINRLKKKILFKIPLAKGVESKKLFTKYIEHLTINFLRAQTSCHWEMFTCSWNMKRFSKNEIIKRWIGKIHIRVIRASYFPINRDSCFEWRGFYILYRLTYHLLLVKLDLI